MAEGTVESATKRPDEKR
jgi:hypothetical protein